MKYVKIFLLLGVLLASCQQKQDEEFIDIDQMAMKEQKELKHIAGEVLDNPQEIFVEDPLSLE